MISIDFSPYFLENNFGTRQTKGYGSYTVQSIDSSAPDMVAPVHFVSFFTSGGNYIDALKKIELLYKTLRSGINGPNENSLYFKSLMFSYATSWNCHWDKRIIKQHYLQRELNNQIRLFEPSEPLSYVPMSKQQLREQGTDTYSEEDGEFDFRDFLGFSTHENWGYYRMQLSKTFGAGERFKSPILFKPICNGNQWSIYVLAHEAPKSLAKSLVTVNNGRHSIRMELFPDFSVYEFLEFAFTEEKISNHFSNVEDHNREMQRRKEGQRDSILAMYHDLKENFRK